MPFTTDAWYTILGSSIVYWTTLCIILMIDKRSEKNVYNKPYSEAAFDTLAVLTQQFNLNFC